MTKTIVFSVLIAFFAISANAQRLLKCQSFQRTGKDAYIIEKGDTFAINQRVLVVKPKKSTVLSDEIKPLRTSKLGFMSIEVPDDIYIENYAKKIENSNNFEYVEYSTRGKYCLLPNDAYYEHQWYLDSITAPLAWELTTGGQSIQLAIIDSGVDASHSDLGYGNDDYSHVSTTMGYDYVNNCAYSTPSNEHGTMVAGIAGAKTDNGNGIAGICGGNGSTGLSIIPYCVGNEYPSSDYVAYAIENAVDKGAKIINLSLALMSNSYVDNAIDYAYNHGVTIVCSSGNGVDSSLKYPASHSKTIAVGAIQQNNMRAFFSNYGTGLDLVAPGVDIYSTILNNSYGSSLGTSFSAPQVSGTIALIMAIDPTLTPDSIRQILRATATPLNGYAYTNHWNIETGYGRLNTFEAVKTVAIPNLEIVGSDQLCGSEVYYVKYLPPGFTVEWSFENTTSFSDTLLQSDYPVANQCIINIENNENLDATLVAKVYEGSSLIKELSKHVSTGWLFTGSYKVYDQNNNQLGTSASIGNGDIIVIAKNHRARISSSLFNSSIISYTTPFGLLWSETTYPRRIDVTFTVGGIRTIVTGKNSVPCNDFRFTVRSLYDPLHMIPTIIPSGGYLYISTESQEDRNDSSIEPWSVEILNVLTGRRVYYDVFNNDETQIDISAWSPGIYVVITNRGNQYYSQKLNIK